MAIEHRPSTNLMKQAAHACLVAKDAAYNLRDFVTNSSRIAVLTVRHCEHELDVLEREMDERIPEAMVRVGERTARELLATVRFITDLERIGDLLLWVAERPALKAFPKEDKHAVIEMLTILEHMLEQVHDGVLYRDVECASAVLREDLQLDRIRRDTFNRHLKRGNHSSTAKSVDILFAVQSIERAGDHATNLAEELVHLIEGRSIRHIRGSARAS